MPTFDITSPDGTKYRVTAPEGATQEQALERVKAQHQPQKDTSVALSDDPNKEYGTVLPFAQDKTTGKNELAFPEMIRQPVQAADKLLQNVRGERYMTPGQQGIAGMEAVSPALGGGAGKIAGRALEEAPAVGKAIASAPGQAVKAVVPQAVERAPTATSEAMQRISAQHYAAADRAGAIFKPTFRNDFIKHAESLAPQEEKAAVGDTELTKLLQRLDVDRDEPLTMKGAQEIDEHLGDLVDKHYVNGHLQKEGRDIKDLQTHLRSMMDNATDADIMGGKNGAAALRQGRQTFSQSMKMRDIERIDERAKNSDNPAATFRSGLRTLLSNPSRMRGYTPAEQDAIRAAAKSGKADAVLKLLSSRAAPFAAAGTGFMMGHVPGAIAGEGIGLGAQALAKRSLANSQTNTANRLFNIMGALPGAEPIQ